MNSRVNKQSYRVLVFNPLKRLIGIFQSVTAASKAFGTTATNVHYACSGRSISCCNLYFRHLDDKVEVTFEDLGQLRLEEYDQLCGVTRKYYQTKAMNRTGMKYNKSTNKHED